jgi:hypothetical protein
MSLRTLYDRHTARAVIAATATTILAVTYIGVANAYEDESDRDRGPQTYTVALFGDVPYNALGKAQYPNLLADINANHVAFSVYRGRGVGAGSRSSLSKDYPNDHLSAVHNCVPAWFARRTGSCAGTVLICRRSDAVPRAHAEG